MTEPWNELDDEASLGVFMAFGAGIGGGIGFAIGFLLGNALLWWPIGMASGISLGLALWFVFSDQELL
ncbi:hypothetical protein ACNS7O_14985 (plasmid) [Haloferacaceae archaeon DSL9]